MIGTLLCRLGLHRWRLTPFQGGSFMGDSYCERGCGAYRVRGER